MPELQGHFNFFMKDDALLDFELTFLLVEPTFEAALETGLAPTFLLVEPTFEAFLPTAEAPSASFLAASVSFFSLMDIFPRTGARGPGVGAIARGRRVLLKRFSNKNLIVSRNHRQFFAPFLHERRFN